MTTGFADYTNTGQEVYQFGTPTMTFASAPKRTSRRNFWILLLIIGEVILIMGLASPYFENRDASTGVTIAGAIVSIVAFLLLDSWFRYRQVKVLIFDQGFSQTRDGKTDDVRWNDVNAVWQNVTKHYRNGVYTGTTHVYTIETNDKRRFVWNDVIKEVEKLGEIMQNAVTNIRLPEAFNAYQSGQTVSFGPLAVNSVGISKGNQTVPWTEIKGVQVEKGFIRVKKQDAWFNFANVPTSSIPNLFIFLSLVDRIIGINTGRR
jgi:hypothetical protein